jgi:hypothetical protein
MSALPIDSHRQRFIFRAVAIGLSILVFVAYLANTSVGAFQPASLARVLEGSATRPYTYRILVPALARFLSPIIPDEMIDWFAQSTGAARATFDRLSAGGYEREAVVVMLIMLLSLAGFVFAEQTLLAELGFGAREQFIWPLAVLLMVLPVTLFTGFYYDFPQLLLVTLSLTLMHRRTWPRYLFVLAMANLNKETAIFLVAIFIVHYWTRLPRREFLEVLAWQAVVCGGVRGSILYWFADNPGATIFYTLPDQIKLFQEHPLGLVFTVSYLSLAIFLVLRRWAQKHEFLRSATVLGLIILGLFVTSGYPLEFRVFLDALPVLGILFFSPPVQQRPAEPIIDKQFPRA